MKKPSIKTFLIVQNGPFPNNDVMPLIIMKQALDQHDGNLVRTIENVFHKNGWGRSWRNSSGPRK